MHAIGIVHGLVNRPGTPPPFRPVSMCLRSLCSFVYAYKSESVPASVSVCMLVFTKCCPLTVSA